MNELDKLYSPSQWSKRLSPDKIIDHHLQFIAEASENARKLIPCELDIPYGPKEREKIDIFGIDLDDDCPILVFIHGGYWQTKEIGRESYHFIALNFHKNNIKSIFVGYELCPNESLPEIVHQVERAANKCLIYAQEKKSKGVYFAGHSAGGHLVACLFANFIEFLPKSHQNLIKAAIPISGVFDLLPIQQTIINDALNLDEKTALEISPMKQQLSNGSGTVFYLVVGGNESSEFKKQSEQMYEKLHNLGITCYYAIINKVDHFNIIELLENEHFELTKYLINIINN